MVWSILIFVTMAGITIRGKSRISPARMTLSAIQPGMTTGHSKRSVIKRCWRPGTGTVALFAAVRIILSDMVRGGLILASMTIVAVRRQSRKGAGRVTLRTVKPGMSPCQGKRCVIKGGRCPGGDTVALFTILGKTQGYMILSGLVFGAVAGVTI